MQSTEVLSGTRAACTASLPRCWSVNADDPTRAVPTRHNLSATNTSNVGGDVDGSLFDDSIQILDIRASKILGPLDDWILAHQHVKARITRLEKLGQQITVSASKFSPHRRREAKGGGDDEDDSREGSIVMMTSNTSNDERKIEERKHEALVRTWEVNHVSITEQLTALIIDTSYVKSVLISLFVSIKESVQGSLVALGPCKQPLPGYGPTSAADHGEVAGNDELISTMPAASAESDDTFKPDPTRNALRMVTSSPLQIATSAVPTPRYAPVDSLVNPFARKMELIEGSGEKNKAPLDKHHRTD